MKQALETLNNFFKWHKRTLFKILFFTCIFIISCKNQSISNKLNSYPLSEELSTVLEENNLDKKLIFISRINGDCSNKAKELTHIQKLFSENIDTSKASILLVMQGEIDFYLNEIIKDKRIIKFPVFLDKQFLFSNKMFFNPSKNLFIIKDNKYLIHAEMLNYNQKKINIDFGKINHL